MWLVQPGKPHLAQMTGGFKHGRRIDLEERPAPSITTAYFGGFPYHLEEDGRPVSTPDADKPPYRVPSMEEVRASPLSGLVAASTFSGCGGSCLGYRMAGFDVRYACELAEQPRAAYAANFGYEPDPTDVRELRPEAVLERLGLERGELDLLDGSPPCTPFSMAGKRQRGWRVEREHAGKSQRVDDLFLEFARLVEGLQPRAFVAENVSGLVRGAARGYFRMILKALEACGYRVEARLVDAQWLGVPQQRQRVVFVGVRRDLERDPAFPAPLPYRYSVRDAIPGLSLGDPAEASLEGYAIDGELRSLSPGQKSERYFSLIRAHPDRPSPTVTAAIPPGQDASPKGAATVAHPDGTRKFTIAELRRIGSFPDDFELPGSYGQAWAMVGNSVPPLMMFHVGGAVRDKVLL